MTIIWKTGKLVWYQQNLKISSSSSNIVSESTNIFKTVEPIEKNVKNETDSAIVHDEKIKYVCDQCYYKTNKQGMLNAHKRMVHIRLSNNTASTVKTNLIPSGKNNIIVSSKFKCEQCEYEAESKTGLEADVVFTH